MCFYGTLKQILQITEKTHSKFVLYQFIGHKNNGLSVNMYYNNPQIKIKL